MNINTIKEHFSIIRDERQSAKVDYPLFDILFGSICAVIAGGQGWTTFVNMFLVTMSSFLNRACLKTACLLTIPLLV